ncbi:hypothetical protein [Streptomyces sp. NRRL B-24484]|uniref:hypothetical protein n=1 Tax=Streptomyces sp. NRRL B-24484 TaxID=1463833 RepID=UPI0005BA6F95|nr:hypothetical protein [Streptomyces sp. NRRL B-24484]
MTDRMTRRYNRELARPGSPLAAVDLNSGTDPALAALGYRYLDRPVFFGEQEIRRFEADLLGTVDLLTSLPERLFDGDTARVCEALGLSPAKAALVGDLQKTKPPRFGRIDAYHDGESLRILEFNASSQTGGQEWVGAVADALLQQDAFREFAGAHGLHHVDTTAELARSLRAAASAVTSGRDPVVALVEGPGGMASYGHAWRPLQRILRGHGLECRLGEIGDLTVDRGRVRFDGTPVDLVYRVFDLDQVVDHPEGRALTERLRDAHRDGRVVLWSPLETDLHANKRWMAYLSDPSLRGHLSAEERATVDRVLPWTRMLTAGRGADRSTVEECRERRADLILKLNEGFAGSGITCGWLVDDRQWERALRQAAEVGAVVQQRVVPRREPVHDPATGRTEDWDSCLGLYWMPGGFAGGGSRLVPSGEPFTLEAARKKLAGVFLYPDATEEN